ncbi:hypothetical protein MtrunA17_Chr8g0359801 [Medicago truncatula]|uniref:Uncharacterized protein n=1 Tax=Medicago truncatula TaxID=3880 RepID=A0A396GK16_MEDTR|nr:hypothetical protein MtrunA17_Chr8g0359801 [Medicago truncatula]
MLNPFPQNCESLLITDLSMQLSNVMDEVVRSDLCCADQQSIISPVKESVPNVSGIMAASDAPLDPTLQKEMNFMKTWLLQSAAIEVPFFQVILKSHRKKINKVAYQTRS